MLWKRYDLHANVTETVKDVNRRLAFVTTVPHSGMIMQQKWELYTENGNGARVYFTTLIKPEKEGNGPYRDEEGNEDTSEMVKASCACVDRYNACVNRGIHGHCGCTGGHITRSYGFIEAICGGCNHLCYDYQGY